MSPEEKREKEEEEQEERRLYHQQIGFTACKEGLPFDVTGEALMYHLREKRAKAQNLPKESSWYWIFCAEFKAGIQPILPEIDTSRWTFGGEWEYDPEEALSVAKKAASIFTKTA
ncbi:hypothetical protein COU13_00825 [Candidatus Kaiserbacteria bacterium CG10_big_fil_rev_8_21_14_0_10_43_70]|uniref:Uncharacterized protein n=1 Tax=Candidatus Kaiserbacteria bacterium CG10_big_fil_rev_8_21_14_0_10_43_70 TaxID=1974605 RepID=A0A2H0UJ67_9BACT|nr:MAG: hypothetical protein COU13_00825 [Candidatus Kaiserbacteria bacterium CG10_big_fil_rev_8_21_14_0_10_43_70]